MSDRINWRWIDLSMLTLLVFAGVRAASMPVPARARQTRMAARIAASPREIDTLPRDRSGLGAPAPSAIPPPGWWDIAKRTAVGIATDRVLTEAAGVTFYALLALFPAMMALVSLFGLVADPRMISDNLSLVAGIVPEGGMTILSDQIHALTSTGGAALGLGALFGLATAIWSANAGMKALFDALNTVYEEKETRGFFYRTVLTLAFTLGALGFVMVALGAILVLPTLGNFGVLGGGLIFLLKISRWPILLVVITLLLAVVYRFGPSRRAARWRWVTWGGAFASVAWLLVAAGFSCYAAHFGNYNKTYGSLGAAIGFMTWIWLSTAVVLIGGELNAQIERQAGALPARGADGARDVGPGQPGQGHRPNAQS